MLVDVGVRAVIDGLGPFNAGAAQMDAAVVKFGNDAAAAGAQAESAMKKAEGASAAVAITIAAMGLAAGAGFAILAQRGSDVNETINKMQAVFGEASGRIEAFAANSAQALGQTRQATLESAATFGNLFTAMGISRDKAADMSIGMEKLAADLSSFNNIPTADALEKLRAGLVGEVEPLRTVGVNLSAAQIETQALAMGFAKVNGELSPASKAQAAYAIILRQTTNAQGDFEKTASGMANSERIIAAEFGDLADTIGSKLYPVVGPLVAAFAQDLPYAFAAAGQAFAALQDPSVIVFLSLMAGMITGALVPAVWALISGFVALVAPLVPFILIGGAVALMLGMLATNFGDFRTTSIRVITLFAAGAVELFGQFATAAPRLVLAAVQAILSGFAMLATGAAAVLEQLPGFGAAAASGLRGAASLAQGAAAAAGNAIGAINGMVEGAVGGIISAGDKAIGVADAWQKDAGASIKALADQFNGAVSASPTAIVPNLNKIPPAAGGAGAALKGMGENIGALVKAMDLLGYSLQTQIALVLALGGKLTDVLPKIRDVGESQQELTLQFIKGGMSAAQAASEVQRLLAIVAQKHLMEDLGVAVGDVRAALDVLKMSASDETAILLALGASAKDADPKIQGLNITLAQLQATLAAAGRDPALADRIKAIQEGIKAAEDAAAATQRAGDAANKAADAEQSAAEKVLKGWNDQVTALEKYLTDLQKLADSVNGQVAPAFASLFDQLHRGGSAGGVSATVAMTNATLNGGQATGLQAVGVQGQLAGATASQTAAQAAVDAAKANTEAVKANTEALNASAQSAIELAKGNVAGASARYSVLSVPGGVAGGAGAGAADASVAATAAAGTAALLNQATTLQGTYGPVLVATTAIVKDALTQLAALNGALTDSYTPATAAAAAFDVAAAALVKNAAAGQGTSEAIGNMQNQADALRASLDTLTPAQRAEAEILLKSYGALIAQAKAAGTDATALEQVKSQIAVLSPEMAKLAQTADATRLSIANAKATVLENIIAAGGVIGAEQWQSAMEQVAKGRWVADLKTSLAAALAAGADPTPILASLQKAAQDDKFWAAQEKLAKDSAAAIIQDQVDIAKSAVANFKVMLDSSNAAWKAMADSAVAEAARITATFASLTPAGVGAVAAAGGIGAVLGANPYTSPVTEATIRAITAQQQQYGYYDYASGRYIPTAPTGLTTQQPQVVALPVGSGATTNNRSTNYNLTANYSTVQSEANIRTDLESLMMAAGN